MVRQGRSDEGDDQQGRKFCDAYLQSSAAVSSVAGRSCSQSAACSRDAYSKSRRRAERTCTEIASERAPGITTVNSFEGNDAAAAYAWHDSAEPKNDQGTQWRD